MSGPNSTPPRPANPGVPPNDPPEPPLEGVLTAEEIEQIKRDGITLGDLIRELEAMG
jgi:hypothetical protein